MADCARSLVGRAFFTLLRFHVLVNFDLAVAFQADHSMHGLIARHRNVDHVVARIEQEVDGRRLIKHPAVYSDLRTFGLALDGDLGHACTLVTTEYLPKPPHRFDVISDAKRLQDRRKLEGLTSDEFGGHGFVEITLLADQDGVISLLRGELCRSHMTRIFAINKD